MKYVIIAALACAAAWFLIAAPRIELAELNHKHATDRVAVLELLDEQRVELIQNQQLQIIEITDNEKRNRELLQAIEGQARAQSRTLEELKRNEKAISDYLAAAVPADLGRLYQRTATTDPSTYRQPPEVRADPMPASSPSSTSD